MNTTTHALVAAFALSACVADPGIGEPDAGVVGPDHRFDPAHVVEVELELDPADWDRLRTQTRSWIEIYAACLAAPFPSPFTYVPATVTVDGVRVEDVAVRKKGFLGSLSDDKPSLKIGFGDGLTLNNAQQDPSYLRQCLSYRTFAAAGLPAPRCNFAHVRVNGADLGLYVHVEAVDRAFVARHFEDDDGNLYEGTYSDFRDGWTATFELETNRSANDRRDLDAVVAALERPDAELLAALDEVVAAEPLFAFWAVEVLITHRDGFAGNANNYFAYHDPTSDRFHFVPWGADTTFVPGPDPFGTGLVSVQAGSLAPWRLYQLPAARDRYVATLRRLLDQIWDEDALEAEIDRMETLIAPIVDPDRSLGHAASVDQVRQFVRDRRAALVAELDAGPPAWSAPLNKPPCLETIGTISGSLQTTWGTVLADAFASGSGALQATIEEVTLDVDAVGAAAGWDPDHASRVRLLVVATLADGTVELVVIGVDAARFRPGSTVPIDGVVASGAVYHYSPTTAAYVHVGLVGPGTLEITAAATRDGAPIAATFQGAVARSPF